MLLFYSYIRDAVDFLDENAHSSGACHAKVWLMLIINDMHIPMLMMVCNYTALHDSP